MISSRGQYKPFLCVVALLLTLHLFSSNCDAQVAKMKTKSSSDPGSKEVRKIIHEGRTNNKVQDHLDVLCNQIGPRLTGSEGERAACRWAVRKFKEMGLENVTMEKWGEFPMGFERGPAKGQMLKPKKMELTFGTNAWTPGTKGRSVGQVVIAPTKLKDLEKQAKTLSGKWVLLPSTGRSRGLSREQREQRRAMRKILVKQSPLGIITPARGDLVVTGGNYRVKKENLPAFPTIRLIKKQYDQIHKMVTDGKAVTLAFDIRNHFRKGPVPTYNVFADIPGTEKPEEFVIVGGHIDSWDGATGATDNAAGCSTTIEAARILMAAGVKPKRTIRFMLWSGEEQGLLGSRAYVKANPKVVDKTSAVFVHDGGTNYVAGIHVPKDMEKQIKKAFQPVLNLDPRTPFKISTTDKITPGGASDHSSFISGGAPGFFWVQRGRAVYRTTHHTQYDTFDTIVPEYQKHSSIVIAVGAFGVANLDEMLSRKSVQRTRRPFSRRR